MVEKLEKYIGRLERRIKILEQRIESYENDKEKLSKDGHWSYGYWTGTKSKIEDIADDLRAIIDDVKNISEELN